MRVFLFQAALLCEDCGNEYRANNVKPAHVNESDESSYDSNDWPKGPYCNGGGEADCPQHCDSCSVFLKNPLTDYGYDYVREAKAARPHGKTVRQWCAYYGV